MRTHVTRWSRMALPLFGVILLLLAGFSACGTIAATGTSTQNAGTVTIGVSLPLTGTFAADGQATRQGYELWQDEVNKSGGLLGHQVRLIILDDNTNVAQTQSNYERLIAVDHVNFVVGPFADTYTVAGAQVAARHGYAFLEGIGTSPSTFQKGLTNLFAVSLSATKYLHSFVHYVLSLPATQRPKTVAALAIGVVDHHVERGHAPERVDVLLEQREVLLLHLPAPGVVAGRVVEGEGAHALGDVVEHEISAVHLPPRSWSP